MKVIHITSSPAAGGAEIYVKDLSIGMAKRGCDVTVLFVSRAKEINRSETFEAEYLSELANNGIGYSFIGNSCKKNVIKGIFKTSRLINKIKPDIIHSHLYFGAVFSLFSHQGKKVYTHHNIKLRASKYIYKLLDFGVSKYIGICDACTIMLKECTNKDVIKINNGVDQARVLIKSEYFNNEVVGILMVGRLTEQKNYRLIIESLVGIDSKRIHLNIAGEGPERESLEKYAIKLGVSEMITFLGNCSNINELMRDADIFAMSSAWEGLPISLIEATLAGLPVIVTDVGGCQEVIDNVGNGVVVKNVQVDEYRKTLKNIINSYELRVKYHKNAIANSGIYTIDSAVENHIKVYRTAL